MVMAYFFMDSQSEQEIKEVEFSEFVTELRNENVEELTLQETDMQGTLKNGDIIHAYAPSSLQLMVINNDLVMPQVYDGKLVVTSEPPKTTPWYVSMLPYLLTIVIFVVIWMVFMNSSQGGAGKAMSFGKSRARMYKSDGKKVTFSDVAGLEEEKEELQEIVDFLRRPKKYTALGARIQYQRAVRPDILGGKIFYGPDSCGRAGQFHDDAGMQRRIVVKLPGHRGAVGNCAKDIRTNCTAGIVFSHPAYIFRTKQVHVPAVLFFFFQTGDVAERDLFPSLLYILARLLPKDIALPALGIS